MRSQRLFLEDILQRVRHIEANLARFSREEIFADPNVYEATLRHLEIIGEAVKNLSAEFKDSHPEMPWRQIGRTRDVLAHVYFGVSEERIWNILTDHIPVLSEFVARILDSGDEDAGGTPTPQ